MFFHHRFIPGLAINTYMVGDESAGRCAVIDPVRDVQPYIDKARDEGLHITDILETHVHADFVSGAKELKARLDGEPTIHCSGEGGKAWTAAYADHVVKNGDTVELGSVHLQAIHTPGHTPEHLVWALRDTKRSEEDPWLIFTGDFLFVGDVGRPDLLGEQEKKKLAHQLYNSVFEVLPTFPDFTEIFPGHGAGSLCGKALGSRNASTVGFERRYNGALEKLDEDAWVKRLLDGMPIAPPYFRRMKKVNAEGPAVIGSELPGRHRYSAEEVHKRVCEHCLIVDVRSKEAFAAAHIPSAINIPLGPSLPTWAGWVLPYDTPTLIVLDNPKDITEVVTHLIRVGFDDIRGYLEGGLDKWETSGFEIGILPSMSVHELHKQLHGRNGRPFVLDVRTDQEWESGRIKDAHHIHGGLLQERIDEVPKDRPVAVVCGSGYRASIAASFLQRAGYDDVANVLGGMSAWNAAELPVTK